MLPSRPWGGDVPSHRELVARRSRSLDADFAAGRYEPFVWPYCLFGFYLVFVYLLFPPNRSRLYYYARYPLYLFNVYWCVRSILVCRSHNPPLQYGIGLINSFACLWLGYHLIWRDTRSASSIVVWRRRRHSGQNQRPDQKSEADASADATASGLPSASSGADGSSVVRTAGANGIKSRPDIATESREIRPIHPMGADDGYEYFWQPLPSHFADRFRWICNIILALRGEGTTHGIRHLPAPPAHVRQSLKRNSPSTPEPSWFRHDSRAGHDGNTSGPIFVKSTRHAMLWHFARVWAATYLLLDAAKRLIERDPYFTGHAAIDSPLPFAFVVDPSACTSSTSRTLSALASHPIPAKAARLALSLCAILALLTNLTALVPLLCAGALGLRDRPWLYPTMFGRSYVEALCGGRDGGGIGGGGGSNGSAIAGWWGRWWHQMFRLAFGGPAAAVCQTLNIKARSGTAARAVAMAVAFSLSACLHAAGSISLNGETRPWAGSGLFFALQPVGIAIEEVFRALAKATNTARLTPSWVGRVLALAWVHFWLYHTAPLLLDDVSRGGVWTTEVVPVSVIDGLAGRGWVRWEAWMLPRWHAADAWYRYGIAF